jgi:LuxR family maltose regulon positive regulatory protein
MRKITDQRNMYYFSDKLKRQLAQIPNHPLTVVEAPSGFGKTTAIREYLKKNLSPDACEYWYTCLGEPVYMAWKGICELLANVNSELADNLKQLEMPTIDTLLYLTTIIRDFDCKTETYLVVDNYHLVNCEIPREFISIFSMHGNQNLHMIFITQKLGTKQRFYIHNSQIHIIDTPFFFFDREGTASLFRREGIRLNTDELENVFKNTEGWISAIRLQIINFLETGSFDYSADIEHLVETAIWNRLTSEEKEFLLSVSVMDSFTVRQAAAMIGQEILPENIKELLKSNDFIRYLPGKNIYTIHSILQDYLRNQFYQYQPGEFQKRILFRAGQSFADMSQYYSAAPFFYKIKNFDAILSMPFDSEYLANQKESKLLEYIIKLVNECPDEILCKYPFVMLILAYQVLFERQDETLRKLCRLICGVIEDNKGFSQAELRRLKGEFRFLMSFTEYNDIKKMCKGRKEALEILGGPSNINANSVYWSFGGTSVLNMFWRESGKLDEILVEMDNCLPHYLKLTRGHGTGANSVMRAEAMLMRGEDNEAEILCHKALYEARSYHQTCICICAVQVLARIAIMRGDTYGYFTAVRNIQDYIKEDSNLYVIRMAELCMSVIYATMGITDTYAKWLYDTESIKKTLYTPAASYAQILYFRFLLREKRYNEIFGISQPILDAVKGIQYMLPQVYFFIFIAEAKYSIGNKREAQEYFEKALAIALPDKVYLPFAQQPGILEALLEAVKNSVPAREDLHVLTALSKRQQNGVNIIKKAILRKKSPLTPREREIAQFARDRLSTKEIADKLCISDKTVKTILQNIYAKLDIHSKLELSKKEF